MAKQLAAQPRTPYVKAGPRYETTRGLHSRQVQEIVITRDLHCKVTVTVQHCQSHVLMRNTCARSYTQLSFVQAGIHRERHAGLAATRNTPAAANTPSSLMSQHTFTGQALPKPAPLTDQTLLKPAKLTGQAGPSTFPSTHHSSPHSSSLLEPSPHPHSPRPPASDKTQLKAAGTPPISAPPYFHLSRHHYELSATSSCSLSSPLW